MNTVTDLEEIVSWWKAYGWDGVPLEYLPTGYIVTDEDGTRLAAGFLYKTLHTPIAWLSWLVINPLVRRKRRKDAFNTLIKGIQDDARASGHTAIFSSFRSQMLVERLQSLGFTRGASEMTEMFWRS